MISFAALVKAVQLTTGVVNYYQAPAATRTAIRKLTLTNTSGAAATATVYLVPAGSSAGAASTLSYQRSVGAGATVDITEAVNHVLEPGASLQMLASAGGALTAIASGTEQS